MKKVTFLIAALICGAWCAMAQNTSNGHEYVDLGLPSGVRWATCNVGATNPEGYGNYYAWGETETKENYTWATYKYGTSSSLTKYNTTDGKTELELEDDAARANWGGQWRTPTKEEWQELIDNCTWTWTENYNETGIKGYEVKGTNENSIFLPMAGTMDESTLYSDNIYGNYWSSSCRADYIAWDACFGSTNKGLSNSDSRYFGQSVRGVVDAPVSPTAVDLGLSVKWADINVGAYAPEEYGDYFAWGETTAKSTYNWSTYTLCDGDKTTLTKYCYDSAYGKDGFTDSKTVLDPEDDAAAVNWGGQWRMPTDAEWQELMGKCTWTWTTRNGINGYEVKATNENSIFLPATGYCDVDVLKDLGEYGSYWSSSLYMSDPSYPNDAWMAGLFPEDRACYIDGRYSAFSVRGVMKEGGSITALQPATAAVNVYTTAGRIVCEGEFRIYDLLGRDVTRLNGSLCGVYVVKTADTAVKVVVR
ncbi:MAG: hypothetical protein ACI30H_01600 [Paludibacteraceae bacterium]